MRSVEEQKAFAGAVDAEYAAGRARPNENLALRIHRERDRIGCFRGEKPLAFALGGDAIDDAFIAGGGVDSTARVDGQCPDVFVFRIEKGRGLTAAIDLVNATVGRRAYIESAVRCGGECMHLHLGTVVKRGTGSALVDSYNFAVVAGAKEK